jgi:hypothetical protein
MEIKVRALDVEEPKSVQELEQELQEKHEQEQQQEDVVEEQHEEPKVEVELNEGDVLSFISKRYNKEINSFDELMEQRQSNEELPEDVAAYLKYKKETGRGFDDFLKLRKDYDEMDQDQLLKEYLLATQEGLDEEDVDLMMDDYKYDEDLDDESRVKKVKVAKKKAVVEAKKYFNNLKEKYKAPLESSMANVSDEERKEFDSYKQYLQQAKTIQEQDERKRNWFTQKTNEVFDNGFKGFEFSVNDRKLMYAPGDASELKKNQLTPANFVNKFLDENGLINDAAGYHRSLAIAMNPEKFAKFFYEQGLSDATEDVMRKTKNINMGERKAPEIANKGGVQIKAVDPDSGKSLKIRSIKKT